MDSNTISDGVVNKTDAYHDKSDALSAHSDDVDTKCGYRKYHPKCLQRFATPGMLLFATCTYALVESFVQWGLVNICLTTWERRYQMSSGQSVWIVTAKDIISIFVTPVFGYMAGVWHKGRVMTAGAICMLIGNFLFLVPQFATGIYEHGTSLGSGLCDNSTYDPCAGDISDNDLSVWLAVFISAQVFFVVASISIWTVGITWVDDNCKYEDTALYMGVLNSLGALGATLGFIVGGLTLEVYVDVGKVDMDQIDIDSSDPRWVGAWWIGFTAALGLTVIPLVLVSCLPREVPKALEWRRNKKSQAYKGKGDENVKYNIGNCAEIGHSLKIIFSNPVFDLVTLAGAIEIGIVTAFAAFLPKIIQFQFGQTTSVAALVAGAVLVPGAVLGQLLGGIIPKCAGLKFRGTLWMQAIAAYICVGCSFAFLAKCNSAPLAGHNADYIFNDSLAYGNDLTHTCNADCECTTLSFSPICDVDGMSYFSPCHAACATETEIEDGTKYYGNCSCLVNATLDTYQAEEGMCPVDCMEFWIFMPLLFIMIVCTFIESTGGYATIMRVVPEKHKAFAFGLQGPIAKLLGTVPIPFLFSFIFDKSCEIWQDNCGEQGSCWIYNSDSLALGMFLAGCISKIISGTLMVIAVCVYKPPPEEFDTVDVDGSSKDIVSDGIGAKTIYIKDHVHENNKSNCRLPTENGTIGEYNVGSKRDETDEYLDKHNSQLEFTHL